MITEFAKKIGVTTEVILGRSLLPHMSDVRRMYWKLLHDGFGYTYKEIARLNDYSLAGIAVGIKHINDALEKGDARIVRLWDRVKGIPEEMEIEANKL